MKMVQKTHFEPNPDFLKIFKENGVKDDLILEALRRTNNDFEKSWDFIEQSQSHPKSVDPLSPTSSEDILLQKAFEMSLSSNGSETNNPKKNAGEHAETFLSPETTRKNTGLGHESKQPRGLRNISNSCYFNSLIQTHFHIPAVRKFVFGFPTNELLAWYSVKMKKNSSIVAESKSKLSEENKIIQFMKELQRLFSRLLFSTESCVDPSHLFGAFTSIYGDKFASGGQEDVGEFNEIFIHLLSEAHRLHLQRNGKETKESPLDRFFCGSLLEVLNFKEIDGEKQEITHTFPFSRLIVRVLPSISSLYNSLDLEFFSTVDYMTKNNFKTKANKSTWISELPPILTFQESRVVLDTSTIYKKSTLPLHFEKIIYLDRFLHANLHPSSHQRKLYRRYQSTLDTLQKELRSYTHYNSTSFSLDAAMDHVLHYFTIQTSLNHLEQDVLIPLLKQNLSDIQGRISHLQMEIADISRKLARCYNDESLKAHPYHLFAVWVHSGGTLDTGHYWTFIRDIENDTWTRFNDTMIQPVDESTVFKESVGGYFNISAYVLIYVSTTMAKKFLDDAQQALELVDPLLKSEVSSDTTTSIQSCSSCEISETLVSDFVHRFTQSAQSLCTSLTYQNPPSCSTATVATPYSLEHFQSEKNNFKWILNYWVWLDVVGETIPLLALISAELYVVVFERGVERDYNSPQMKAVCQKLDPRFNLTAAFDLFVNKKKRFGELECEHAEIAALTKQCLLVLSKLIGTVDQPSSPSSSYFLQIVEQLVLVYSRLSRLEHQVFNFSQLVKKSLVLVSYVDILDITKRYCNDAEDDIPLYTHFRTIINVFRTIGDKYDEEHHLYSHSLRLRSGLQFNLKKASNKKTSRAKILLEKYQECLDESSNIVELHDNPSSPKLEDPTFLPNETIRELVTTIVPQIESLYKKIMAMSRFKTTLSKN